MFWICSILPLLGCFFEGGSLASAFLSSPCGLHSSLSFHILSWNKLLLFSPVGHQPGFIHRPRSQLLWPNTPSTLVVLQKQMKMCQQPTREVLLFHEQLLRWNFVRGILHGSGKSPRWKSVKELFFLPGCTREKLHLALAGLKGVFFLAKVRFPFSKQTFRPAALRHLICWHNQTLG